MVVAKTNEAHLDYQNNLKINLGRYYLAIVDMPLKENLLSIENPIGRKSK